MTSLKLQKRVAASLMKTGSNKVRITGKASEIKTAITRDDVRGLIVKGLITKKRVVGTSRGRARKVQEQKKKGRRKGHGTRKGKKTARTPRKRAWINTVRAQRSFAKQLKQKELISSQVFKKIYLMIKGGFFRSRSHVKTYLNEQDLIKKKGAKKNNG